MKESIKEFNDLGLEVLFFRDDNGFHCEILRNDLYVLSIIGTDIDELEKGMRDLLHEVTSMMNSMP